MSKELIVSSGRHETRVAILEDDQVVELFHEREKEYSLAGSIHKGRVTRVLPGMQSAFVDIGLERDAFLYVSDFFEDNDEYDAVVSGVEEKILKMDKGEKVADAPVVEYAPAEIAAAPAPAPQEQRAAPQQQNRPPQENRDGGNRDGGNRNRRGRRRRGGRGPGGLPDSKFYSPADDKGDTEVEETAAASTEETPVPVYETPRTFDRPSDMVDDFMVLPGESLAKYSAPEDEPAPAFEEPQAEAPAIPQMAAPEPALPFEHPHAALGSASASYIVEAPEPQQPEPEAEILLEGEQIEMEAELAEPELRSGRRH